MNNIYLDNAATTPVDERVKDAMLPYLTDRFGNPSSAHRKGREVKVALEEARETISEFIGAKPAEIFFTSGGTEANNFALKGMAFANFGKRNHLISTQIEHSAVTESLEYLRDRFGYEITLLGVNSYGEIDMDELRDKIKDDTFLVSVMHSNNETGIINDINAISEIIGERKIHLHTDSVQSIGKTEFNVNEILCDTCTISSHKIFAPKGTGVLYIRKGTVIDKTSHGGKQERDRRGGTENIAGIMGLKKAAEILRDEMEKDTALYTSLKNGLISSLINKFGNRIIINSKEKDNSLPNIVNISLNPEYLKTDADALLIKLDTNGIFVSSGSACTSGSIKPSHVMKAIGYDDETARSSLRISFGRFSKKSDTEEFVKVLDEIIR